MELDVQVTAPSVLTNYPHGQYQPSLMVKPMRSAAQFRYEDGVRFAAAQKKKKRGSLERWWYGLQHNFKIFRLAWQASRTKDDAVWDECERQVAFQCKPASNVADIPFDDVRRKVQEVTFEATDGATIHGWYVPPEGGKPTVIFSHGKDESLIHGKYVLKAFADSGYGFLGYNYRGFGKSFPESPGEENKAFYEPTEERVAMDLEGAIRFTERPNSEIVLIGRSLGAAVATRVAARAAESFKAVVLTSAFTNTPDVFRALKRHYWIPQWVLQGVESRVKQRFDNTETLPQIHADTPIFIIHGKKDKLAPFSMAEQLHQIADSSGKQVTLVPIENGVHHNLFAKGAATIMEKLNEALLN